MKVSRSLLGLTVLGLTACTGNFAKFSSGADSRALGLATFDANKFPVNKLVCNPLSDENENTTLDGGLQASLFYLKSDQPRYQTVGEVIRQGVKSNKNLFFSNLNVPTRLFTAGFPLEAGGLVKTDEGVDLVEYFALRLTGSLGLATGDSPGYYELALLSDDGAVWTDTSDEGGGVLVNNDGTHPTRFGCGKIVYIGNDTRIPSRIDYHQGPRYHIAAVPMWRKVSEDAVANQDVQCGKSGNEMYFDYNNGSAPKQAYKEMLARGWKAVRAENWRLPDGTDYNPCYDDGELPIISEFAVNVGTEGYMTVQWQTNIPATSQVVYRNLSSGVEDITMSDNILRTTHSVTLIGLQVGAIYDIKGIAISNTLGRAVSKTVRAISK